MTNFSELGLSAELLDSLTERGFSEAFPIQALAIPDAIAGRDVCGKAKTGSGKTLAFGLPMLVRIGTAQPHAPLGLVLVPTAKLASQVTEELAPLAQRQGQRVLAVYGGVSMDKQIEALKKGVELVVATPGRAIDLMEQGMLRWDEVEVLVLDEADRMADMGFMPQVQKILYRMTQDHQTLLFSATLDGAVNQLVKRYMKDPVFHEIEGKEPTVEEMDHRFLLVHQMDKVKVAGSIINGANRTVLFVRTKRGADRLVSQLEREGVKAGAIHGDLRQSARERALSDFVAGQTHALVATDVAARGIHVDGVDVVVHYDPPEDHKAYLHRSGRTARAGESGVAVSLMLWNEENHIRVLQRRLALDEPIVEVFSNDRRLRDLKTWEALADA